MRLTEIAFIWIFDWVSFISCKWDKGAQQIEISHERLTVVLSSINKYLVHSQLEFKDNV